MNFIHYTYVAVSLWIDNAYFCIVVCDLLAVKYQGLRFDHLTGANLLTNLKTHIVIVYWCIWHQIMNSYIVLSSVKHSRKDKAEFIPKKRYR